METEGDKTTSGGADETGPELEATKGQEGGEKGQNDVVETVEDVAEESREGDQEEEMNFNVEPPNENDNEESRERDPVGMDKVEFEEEGQSLDQFSNRSDETSRQSAKDDGESRDVPNASDLSNNKPGEDKNESNRGVESSEVVEENTSNNDSSAHPEVNLQCDEPLLDEDDGESEIENVVAEVDISSMMEMNMEEGDDENNQVNLLNAGSQNEPDVIPLDSDDEMGGDKKQNSNDSEPVLLNIDQSIFDVEDDEERCVTVVDSFDVMQFGDDKNQDSQSARNSSNGNSSTFNRRPRRAAAEAAAKTIHQISAQEQGEPPPVFRTRRRSQTDSDFNINLYKNTEAFQQPLNGKQMCFVCKKTAICSIVVKQFGTDLHLCSNICFNRFRNQGNQCRTNRLPCCKCGQKQDETNSVYFWETMNFCSDICVGRYQMDVGRKCCTCGNNVPWGSLGKYCVRFGSDIRQFCTPPCLENYKQNAKVCFNCQLDIRRNGNVILANIPSKSTPKEFCSNDCVEMYYDRNLHQPTRAKPPPLHVCCICLGKRPVHKEIVLQSSSFKVCSDNCWRETLKVKGIVNPEKCEMCAKFVSMDLGFSTPVYWLSSLSKVFGFCSHICKNLFILNSRRILSCTTCKVKKYNFDLIERFTHSKSEYAVCSLACLPQTQEYLRKLRTIIYIPQPISDKTTPSGNSLPMITSVSSAPGIRQLRRRRKEQHILVDDEIQVLDELDDVDIGDPETFLDSISVEFLDSLLEYLSKRPPNMKSKGCSAKPRTKTVETQTDVSELNEMERIQLVPEEIVHYIPVPIPCLINIPFPGYFLESAVPIPFPVPIPVPIPIPIIIPSEKKKKPEDVKETEPEPDKKTSVPPDKKQNGENKDKSSTKYVPSERAAIPPQQSKSPANASLKSLTELTSEVGNNSPTTSLPIQTASFVPTPPQNTIEPPPCPPAPLVNYNPPQFVNFPTPVISPQVVPSYSYNNPSGNYYSPPMPSPIAPVPGYNTHSPIASYMGTPPMPPIMHQPPPKPHSRVEFALRAWKMMFGPTSDPRAVSSTELSAKLCDLVNRGTKPNGEKYRADMCLYLSLGIQQMLREYNRVDKIFYENVYYNFVLAFTECAERELTVGYHPSIEEIHFWETCELGASSPGVLLFTLMYMFYKYFGLKTWQMHSALHFNHIAIQSRYDQFGRPLRYLSIIGLPGAITTEIPEDVNCPERCFIKIYEFYKMMSESPNGTFYKSLRHDYTPRTPWFTSQPLDRLHVYQMLVRASMIRSGVS